MGCSPLAAIILDLRIWSGLDLSLKAFWPDLPALDAMIGCVGDLGIKDKSTKLLADGVFLHVGPTLW